MSRKIKAEQALDTPLSSKRARISQGLLERYQRDCFLGKSAQSQAERLDQCSTRFRTLRRTQYVCVPFEKQGEVRSLIYMVLLRTNSLLSIRIDKVFASLDANYRPDPNILYKVSHCDLIAKVPVKKPPATKRSTNRTADKHCVVIGCTTPVAVHCLMCKFLCETHADQLHLSLFTDTAEYHSMKTYSEPQCSCGI